MDNAYTYTKSILNRYSIRAKKSLGQNFLIDDQIIDNIIIHSGLLPGESVVEVGPGSGVLTRALAETAGMVWALEIDNNLSTILAEEFRSKENIKIIHTDALKFQLKGLELPTGLKVKLIANLPYYITSPLINHFLAQREYLHSMTIMVQQEVATRIAAKPGSKDYGILSIATQAFCNTTKLFVVPPSSFLPPPKVHSAVVHLEMLAEPRIEPAMEKSFFTVVKAAFSQRRKTLLNSLSQGLGLHKEMLTDIIEGIGISPMARAENLTIDDYRTLTGKLFPVTTVECKLV